MIGFVAYQKGEGVTLNDAGQHWATLGKSG